MTLEPPFRLQWFSTVVAPRTAGRVLEVGCGSGQLLELLAARCPRAEFVGIDRSELQARRAVQRLDHLANRATVRHLALEAAAAHFANAPFARVLAMNVNMFWTDPAAARSALHGLLAPRGRLLLGYEPPSARGRAALRAKLLRALPTLGASVLAEHKPNDSSSGVFAVELTVQR